MFTREFGVLAQQSAGRTPASAPEMLTMSELGAWAGVGKSGHVVLSPEGVAGAYRALVRTLGCMFATCPAVPTPVATLVHVGTFFALPEREVELAFQEISKPPPRAFQGVSGRGSTPAHALPTLPAAMASTISTVRPVVTGKSHTPSQRRALRSLPYGGGELDWEAVGDADEPLDPST
jgi:hypothetical protein